MSRAGRKPKAVVEHGIYKKSKEYEEQREVQTPAYDRREFKCPAILQGSARKKWDELVELISSMRNSPITDADKDQMMMYCNAWADYEFFDKEIKGKPAIYVLEEKPGKHGETVYVHLKNLNYDRRKQAAETITKCGDRLCLDPISRAKVGLARIGAEQAKADSVLDNLMNRKGDND